MIYYRPMFFLLIFLLPLAAYATTAEEKLQQIFADFHEFTMKSNPEWATYGGDYRYNDQLTDLSEEAVEQRLETTQEFLQRINKIDPKKLSDFDQINYQLFKSQLKDSLQAGEFPLHYLPLQQQGGIHIEFPQIVTFHPFRNKQDCLDYLARLEGFAKQVEDVIANMQKGMAADFTPPRFIIEQVLTQIENILHQKSDNNVFLSPLGNLPLEGEEKQQIITKIKTAVSEVVLPGYQKLYKFIKQQYLPHCRKHAGVWSLPQGKEYYKWAVAHHTTTELSPEEIHQIGLKEVARLRKKMKQLKDQIGFAGNIDEFHNFIKTDPQFYYQDKDKLLAKYREILNRVDEQLPKFFQQLPKADYALREMEAYRAKSAPQAYYYPPPEDGSRPGYFYVNTYELSSRPKYTMTALALHEAVPGHHLQIALAQELPEIPDFRKYLSFTGYIEGWALYAESLGYEMDMYQDPYPHYGALTFEMWRACRLVVDTGIHHKKWTRQQAFDFMKKYTPNSDLDILSEVDRYIVWPGQALAYKIGELKIKELRQKAEAKWQDDFNIKEFHHQVLRQGAIPLSLLEKTVISWLNREKEK